MGTSNWQNISFCCETIHRIAPTRTLDIGIGSLARWGSLVREFTDVWAGNILPEQWRRRIDGIEAFPQQIGAIHENVYDSMFVGDAFEVIDQLGCYDLVILGDVLEHFPEAQALPMLDKCLRRAQIVLVTTPLGRLEDWPQEDAYGNQWERHQVVFTAEQFLDSDRWRVIDHKLFGDLQQRRFGTFVLGALSGRMER